jgi:hypothetical protein
VQIIEPHLVFDFLMDHRHLFPIDFELQAEHDCSDERISAVW